MAGDTGTPALIGVGSRLRAAGACPASGSPGRAAQDRSKPRRTQQSRDTRFHSTAICCSFAFLVFLFEGAEHSMPAPLFAASVSRLFEIAPAQSCPYRRRTSRHSFPTRKL
jgi:hypothetical protein